jgi:hypothetical protein
MAQRSNRTGVVLLAVVVIAVGGGLALKALWNTAKEHFASQTCTIGDFVIDTEQAEVAAEMVGAVTQYRRPLPEKATVLVLAAGLLESKLSNVPAGAGDRDSIGVLQQRPTQGNWGMVPGGPNTLADRAHRLTDVGFATTEFLDYLVEHVPGWRTKPIGKAIQLVQISGDPSGDSYAQHEPEARALADAFQGTKPAAITCDYDEPTEVASADKAAELASDQLGINTPQSVGTDTVRVPGAHWQTVAWFIANGNRLGVDRVAYDGKVWTRKDGWTSADATNEAVVATLFDLGSG